MENVLEVENLYKFFPINKGLFISRKIADVQAIAGISFHIQRGETLGLVGESGCGKSTTGLTILRLIEPTSGKIKFAGQDIMGLDSNELKPLRQKMQIIFQDPYSSLNPRMTVGDIISEPMMAHKVYPRREWKERVKHLLEEVDLHADHIDRFPHEFSGGQRQRIGIARALAAKPEFIVCDEPVSALDVSVQAQVLNLLNRLQEQYNLTFLFISHDLSVVKHICDRIAVMYLGKIVEMTDFAKLFGNASHPYTRALMGAIPVVDPNKQPEEVILEGEIPDAADPPVGCRFHTRCPVAKDFCRESEPQLEEVSSGHKVACFLAAGHSGLANN